MELESSRWSKYRRNDFILREGIYERTSALNASSLPKKKEKNGKFSRKEA